MKKAVVILIISLFIFNFNFVIYASGNSNILIFDYLPGIVRISYVNAYNNDAYYSLFDDASKAKYAEKYPVRDNDLQINLTFQNISNKTFYRYQFKMIIIDRFTGDAKLQGLGTVMGKPGVKPLSKFYYSSTLKNIFDPNYFYFFFIDSLYSEGFYVDVNSEDGIIKVDINKILDYIENILQMEIILK